MTTETFEHSALTHFLTQAQEAKNLSDEQMAQALGFSRATVYTFIKNGTMKMPVGKVPVLARILGVSASEVLEVVLRDQGPELLDVIKKTWGPLNLSDGEKKLLVAYRALVNEHEDVEPLILDGRSVIALITT